MSVIPYISFLITYGANVYVRILPVSDDLSSVRLYNVSYWESLVIPFSVHKWISSRHYTLFDFLSAVPYLAHYCIPVLFPLFLYLSDRLDSVSRFYRLLGLSCWAQYVIWYLLPTYPPWSYATEPTSAPVQTTLELAASVVQLPEVGKSMLLDHMEGQAFSRLDQIMNIKFFHSMFAGNPVPFAAFPSGHVAWSMCMLLVLPNESRRVMFVYVCWVTWAVLYSGHHYLFRRDRCDPGGGTRPPIDKTGSTRLSRIKTSFRPSIFGNRRCKTYDHR